jgi:CheY-like chemotaxis protein
MAEPSVGGARVLLVDDEPALLRVTARHLRAAGYVVTECGSGTLAARMIDDERFDVILCDIDMPGLSGIELLQVLRERSIATPVVLVTGAPALGTAMQAVEHGAFKYLLKPVETLELKATVQRAIASGTAGDASRRSAASGPVAVEAPAVTRATIGAGVVLAERYRLRGMLGKGGMSEVWEAEQLRTGRDVAVKLLHAALNALPGMRRRLLREARAAGHVGHPNVVDVLDAFELADGTPVLVMALLRGRTLGDMLARAGALPLAEVADLLLPVVSAVGTAHARGVIHRDLKPDNVFLCEENGRTSIKVVDFGIAKLMSSDENEPGTLTATGAVVGTAGYMSPEQGLGERDIDQRADVWSIGVMAYELLAGVRPVPGDTVGQMLRRLFTESITPIRDRVPDLPAALADLIDRMLARERDGRPNDLRPFYVELARHARVSALAFGAPVTPKAPPSGTIPTADAELPFARTESGEGIAVGKG